MIEAPTHSEIVRYASGGHYAAIMASRQRGTPADLREVFSDAPLFYWHFNDTTITQGGSGSGRPLGKLVGAGDTPNIFLTGGDSWLLLQAKVTVGGILGTSRLDISFDGGATWPMADVTTAAIVNLTGVGAGRTLTMAAGTYVLNDIYWPSAQYVEDRSANNHDLDATSLGGSQQPNLLVGPNYVRAIHCVDASGKHFPRNDLTITAPGTTPLFLTGLMRIDEDTATSDTIFGGSTTAGGATLAFRLLNNAGAFQLFNGTTRTPAVSSVASVLGEWLRFYCYFSNSAADYLHIGGSGPATVASCGNNAGASYRLARSPNGASSASVSFCEFSAWQFLPDAGEIEDADDYYGDVYGGSVLTAA